MEESTNWSGQISNTYYIYYQGRNSSQVQVAKYIGGKSLITTTNEKVIKKSGFINTIPREKLWLYPEIDEMDL